MILGALQNQVIRDEPRALGISRCMGNREMGNGNWEVTVEEGLSGDQHRPMYVHIHHLHTVYDEQQDQRSTFLHTGSIKIALMIVEAIFLSLENAFKSAGHCRAVPF